MKVKGVNFETFSSKLLTSNVNFDYGRNFGNDYVSTYIFFDKVLLNPGESAFAIFDFIMHSTMNSSPIILELVGLTSSGTAYRFFEVYGLDSSGNRIIQGVHNSNVLDPTIEFSTSFDIHIYGFEVYLPFFAPDFNEDSIWYSDEGMGDLQIPLDSASIAAGRVNTQGVYSGHTDEDRFQLNDPYPHHEMHFDLGFVPPFDPEKRVLFGVRALVTESGSSWALVYSQDNINWEKPDGTRHDAITLNSWFTTVWDLGAANSNVRYFGLRGFNNFSKSLHIAYLYLENVNPGVVGFLSWNASKIWKIQIGKLFVNGVSYE